MRYSRKFIANFIICPHYDVIDSEEKERLRELLLEIDASEFTYVENNKEAVLLAQKIGRITVTIPATPVKSLKTVSLNNEMLPQKSTYFYPKLTSGIVLASLV